MYAAAQRFQIRTGQLPAGDAGVSKTLALMRGLVAAGTRHPLVRQRALELLRGAGVDPRDARAALVVLHRFVADRIAYVRDPVGVEWLQGAHVTLATGGGDCDDKTVLLISLARAIGLPGDLRFRVVAMNARAPGQFSHVYPVMKVRGGDVPLDATFSGTPFGWEPRGRTRMGEARA